ncbi:2Fe-2S iron-sulfur cluster-binding protein [Paraburkholderia azotifigens]|uniref:2Fe-2S iron-sulfur cluster-binding protein n=1 Tax=Paraburkholderia azotifigens TaxID=2057004 RepID=A0ABU9R2R0_9BURK|nr:2Fe-2S iron-sulfur cluster binding domain-containing protein [Paraburkholderia azotifigens]
MLRYLREADGLRPEDAVHLEYFAGADPIDQGTQTSFDVKLARSGKVLTIPDDKTIVDVRRVEGVEVEASCEQGVCGTCVTRVLDGVPEHHDCFLTAQEHRPLSDPPGKPELQDRNLAATIAGCKSTLANGTNSLGKPAVAAINTVTPSSSNRQALVRIGMREKF